MLRRRLVPLVAVTVLALGMPAAAQAATLNLVDERGDVHRINADDTVQAVPREARADILRTTIQHTDRALIVSTKLRQLPHEAAVGMLMRVRTNDGTYREFSLEANRRIGWRGQTIMTRRDGVAAQCATSHRMNYTSDVMTLRIPRSCLNDPRWIQTSVMSVFAGRQLLVDNPHTQRPNVPWSPRIRRG